MFETGLPDFKPLNEGWRDQPNGWGGVQPIESLPGGGDIHDTFGVDPQGNILPGGHTTVVLPGGRPEDRKPLNWE